MAICMHRKFYHLLCLVCLFGHSLSLMAQNRIGTINQHSSDSECREYFKRNILDLDPIEGVYQVEAFSQEVNNYRKFPLQKMDGQKIVIYKERNGVFRVTDKVTMNRIGETMYYNFIVNWKDAGGGASTTRISYNGTTFEVTHEIPQKVVNRNLNQNYINANTRIFFTENYVKEYPTYTMYQEATRPTTRPKDELEKWSGTGFALKDGYVVTNYHVIENAQTVQIQGVKGDFSLRYNASIVATDKNNDLAILRISDNRFSGFGTVPYNVKAQLSEVGEDIFVLGYPLTSTMGDEIKLTTGVVSSRTGFQGDISSYQISAPIQPGNSGAPLFDGKGNLVGIVSAKHRGAENVGYAIKTTYLMNLVESSISAPILPNSNQTTGMSLPNKVKSLKNYVYMISCSNSGAGSVNSSFSSKINDDLDIINPSISIPISCKGLKIERVQINFAQTIVHFEYDNSANRSGWVTISPNTYIISYNTGKKYRLAKAEGIPIEPQKYNFSSPYERIRFKLIFPALPKGTTQFNLIESESSSWKFYGIKLE